MGQNSDDKNNRVNKNCQNNPLNLKLLLGVSFHSGQKVATKIETLFRIFITLLQHPV